MDAIIDLLQKNALMPRADMARLLDWLMAEAPGPRELILNGDIFDFDAICKLPHPPPSQPPPPPRVTG